MRLAFTAILAMAIAVSAFAQQMQQPSALQRRESSTTGVRSARLPLEDRLRELEKRRTDLEGIVDYIPLEGAVDENDYIIGPGDQFTISIAGGIEEQFQAIVGADGSIVLPYITAVKVAGKTLAEAKADINSALGKVIRESDLTVSLTSARMFIVNVVGMVNLPGNQTVSAVHRVFSAIELAGGRLPSGDLSRVKLIRRGAERELDLSRFLTLGDISQNPYLLDGDLVVVPGADISKPAVFVFGAGYSGEIVNIESGVTAEELIRRVDASREHIDLADIGLVRGGEIFSINLFGDGKSTSISAGDSIFFKDLPDSVYVGGRVVAGGTVPYVSGADYRAYVAMAGGVSTEGGIGQVRIIRGGEKMKPNKAGTVRRGDVIIVGTSPWYVAIETFKGLASAGSFASAIYVIGFRD